MRLIIPILLNCLLVLAVYLIDKYTPAKKLPYIVKQIIIGLGKLQDTRNLCIHV